MESNVICASAGASREIELTVEGNPIVTPTYFPAISSFDIKYSLLSLVRHFRYYPRVLISAYDLFFQQESIGHEIYSIIEKIPFVFLDSGVFEASRKGDKAWNRELHEKIISKTKFDFHSSFDLLPSKSNHNLTKKTIDGILLSKEQCDKDGFVPIIHGNPKQLLKTTETLTKYYPELCKFLAIAERDCGDDIVEKARTIHRIRNLLDLGEENNHSRILHILGCGEPLSMLLFIYAGANSFDSLDWIKFVFDSDRMRLVNFSHLNLLNCDCIFCSRKRHNYVDRVLMHNLWFYQNYVQEVKTQIEENTLGQLMEKHFSRKLLDKI